MQTIPTEQLKRTTQTAAKKMAQAAPKQRVSYGLGLFSLALGLSEVLLTRSLARKSGLPQNLGPVVRTFGVREITSGIGLLTGKREQTWLWSRVAGDALDIGLLSYAFYREKDSERRLRIAISAAAVAPVVIADIINVLRPDEAKTAQAA